MDEVFLDITWYLVDPTGMSTPDTIAKIGVGRDAADVSFLTSYGSVEMQRQSLQVNKAAGTMSFRGNRLGAVVAFRAGDAEGASRAKTRCRHGIGKLPVSHAISCAGQPHERAVPKT